MYLRVSTQDQNSNLQRAELEQYIEARGWEKTEVYEDVMSGAKSGRPGLTRLLKDARRRVFDAVAVWKLDRFGRSVAQLVENVQTLDFYGVRFIAVTQGIDTDKHNPTSRLLLHMMAAIAEFERELIKERVHAGLKAAKKAGTVLGRPKRVFDRNQVHGLRAQGLSIRQISERLEVGMGTVTRTLKEAA